MYTTLILSQDRMKKFLIKFNLEDVTVQKEEKINSKRLKLIEDEQRERRLETNIANLEGC